MPAQYARSDDATRFLNVLVVDGEPLMREILVLMLESVGVREARRADGVAEAFAELQDFAADLVIVEAGIQPIGGLAFARLMRRNGNILNPNVPIIMITAQSTHDLLKTAKAAGIDSLLIKPVSHEKLRAHFHALRDGASEEVSIEIPSLGPVPTSEGVGQTHWK